MKYYWLFPYGVEGAAPVLTSFPSAPGNPDWRGMPPMNVMGPFRSRKAAEAWMDGGKPPTGAVMYCHECEVAPQ